MESYPQTISIAFDDEAAAQAARIEILPLHRGCERAITSRWDDNTYTSLMMRATLEKHGYRGTFFLNATEGGYYGPDYGLASAAEHAKIGGKLLAGGNTIGGHSLTHPFLTVRNRNTIFREVLGIRADRESSSGCPIGTFSFPFCDYRNDTEGDVVHRDIAELMRRAGYYHIAEPPFSAPIGESFSVSNLLPGDGKDIDEAFQAFLANPKLKESEPNISFAMHAWYSTPEAWARFEAQLEKYGHNPAWWYCNTSEYAAYRYQFKHTRLSRRIEGRTLIVELQRPALLDLNDAIPLSFQISGIPGGRTPAVSSPSATLVPLPSTGDNFRFELPHAKSQGLPSRIGFVENAENRKTLESRDASPGFPGLKALLNVEGDQLRLVLKNETDKPLQDIRLCYRLPLAWQPGVIVERLQSLDAGREWTSTVALQPGKPGFKYEAGSAYYAAQVDFLSGETRGRLHVSCDVGEPAADPGFPRDGFQIAGPLEGGLDEQVRQAATISSGAKDKIPLVWRKITPDQNRDLDPEIIFTPHPADPSVPATYLLRSRIISEAEQTLVYADAPGQVLAVFLNGKRVSGKELCLNKGGNEIFLLSCSGTGQYSARHYGAFFRLGNPSDGLRATNIRYSPGE
ncbi:MAG: hypothetical protein WC378_14145 [Opitutaceae bacterium]|jgi:peptidoglycan/xylan/chitin deacetylase (PgdA/CDA1 family)